MLLIEALHLSKTFHPGSGRQVRALDQVSLSIARGSCVVLTGPSGSGKSTLLSLLGALDRPSSGRLSFEGRDLTHVSDVELARVRRRMGFVFQDFALLSGLSLVDNIASALIPRGVPRRERHQIATMWLERVGMPDHAGRRPEELSGGERQRLAVARALAGRPELLLADEPTSSLDPETARVVLQLLHEFRMADKTLIIAGHDGQLLELATHILRLEAGRICTLGNETPACDASPRAPAAGETPREHGSDS